MLLELRVENYAVVEQSRIRFQEGLNVLTGETGSGKSIVVDSLGLLLGARASIDLIRSGEAKACVSGIFSVEIGPEIRRLLEEAGIEAESDDELIVQREIATNGKSRAFVANRPATAALLRQLAPSLGDIHGQNEQQSLYDPQAQRDLLDEFAGARDLRERVAQTYSKWRCVAEKLEQLSRSEQEKLRLLDLWSFQRKEIDAVSPRPNEDGELQTERKILQNVTKLQENASAAFALLYESPDSVTTQLRQATKRLDELLRIDDSLSETAISLKQISMLADEASFTLRDYLGRIEGDPARLEEVESRLAALEQLKRKYGRTIEEVLRFRDEIAKNIDDVENAAEHRAELQREFNDLGEKYEKAAGELSASRVAAAARLAKQVESELASLAMSGTRFQIAIRPGEWSSTGTDVIGFLVAPNRGEEPKPMERIASGGELSRIALALKTALGDADRRSGIPTLVFDEVDAGVGGAAAAAIGKRLKALSRRNQVICVTHLAQIAGFADHQYAVSKREKNGRVTTQIEELGPAERAREIGRMLSGEQITPEALKQAEQLMQAGANS
jgi:DNA repair protein RecN (Recombination protein N)